MKHLVAAVLVAALPLLATSPANAWQPGTQPNPAEVPTTTTVCKFDGCVTYKTSPGRYRACVRKAGLMPSATLEELVARKMFFNSCSRRLVN